MAHELDTSEKIFMQYTQLTQRESSVSGLEPAHHLLVQHIDLISPIIRKVVHFVTPSFCDESNNRILKRIIVEFYYNTKSV
jgi:hypothetical protein